MTTANTERHPPLVAFIHIPKTAGLTLYWILNRQYSSDELYSLDWTKNFDVAVKDFASLSASEKKRIRMVRGHMRFAVRSAFPADTEYFTVLRNPVERVVSYYHYVRRSSHHRFYHDVTSRNMTLEQFVDTIPDWNVDNCQTRFLSDDGDWEPGMCTADMLESAKKNLAKIAVVGLTERFDETLILLKRTFHWKLPVYFRQNVSKSHSPKERITPSAMKQIVSRNSLDMLLYEHAKGIVNQRIQQEAHSFKRELWLFKVLNRGFQRWHSPYYAMKTKLLNVSKHE